ncbi:MAG: peptide ABC transporter substrate-binding protein [bacterium]
MCINISSEPPSLDWSITTDHASIQVLQNIMEGLTRFDEDLQPEPALAKSWSVKKGGSRYVFHLRKDARWTDGKPVVAGDFVYAWRRLLDPATAGEYAYFLYMVKNAEAVNSGEKELSELGVEARDRHTLVVDLERPVVFFPMITTFVSTFPLRRDVVEKYGDDWSEPEHIQTCGPFRMKEWWHEYRIVAEKNPDYFGEGPYLDRVVFYMVEENSTALSLYQTGDLDVADPLPPPAIPAYEDSPQYKNYPFFASYYYGFNVDKPPVDDPRVRTALSLSVDRTQIPKIIKGRQIPNPTVIPAGMEYANPELGHSYAPERGRELLAEAGYPGGKGFPEITIGYNTQESHKMLAEFVQQEWNRNLDIQVQLRNMEWKVYLKKLQHDPPHVFRLGWILDYPDPDAVMTVFTSDSGNNHTNWKSDEYDRLVRKGAMERDPEKRQKIYDRAQRLLCKDASAVMPLYTYTINMLVKPYVKDFPMNSQDLLYLRKTRIVEGEK